MNRELSDIDDFRKRALDEHFEQYFAFTRLILSLATGSFSLFAALSGTLFSNPQYVALAKSALPLLLVSMLSGVLVQYRLFLRPLNDLKMYELLRIKQGHKKAQSENLIIFRRIPSVVERIAFHVQAGSFVLAFILLACQAVFGGNGSLA